MLRRAVVGVLVLVVGLACGSGEPSSPRFLAEVFGDSQHVTVATSSAPLQVQVVDQEGAPVEGAEVSWNLLGGPGSLSANQVISDATGLAQVVFTAGTVSGTRQIQAKLGASSVTFDLTIVAGAPVVLVQGGLLATEVNAGGFAPGLGAIVQDVYNNPVAGARVNFVTTGGTLSQAADTSDAFGGVAVALTAPATPGVQTVTGTLVANGDTASWKVIGFVDLTALTVIPQPANYGIHDQFIRDGLAFASVWNTGLRIYDVGNGVAGGTPAVPVLVSTIVTGDSGVGCNCVHNAWWFHDPVLAQNKYLFVGQEGPGAIGTSSSGRIHVVDVSNLSVPVEVASFALGSVSGQPTGVHNFWMDEPHGILYAAYYNGGVVSLDVSGTLTGDLGARKVSAFKPAGNAYIWGVMQVGSRLFATDMLNGLWSLNTTNAGVISAGAGLGGISERFSSDLWVTGSTAYSGTWGSRAGKLGNVTKIWELNGSGLPVLRDSLKLGSVGTVSDNEVSPGGELLLATAEGGAGGGLYIYERSDPLHPHLVGRSFVLGGLHTGTFAEINGKLYVFASKNPAASGSQPALVIYDVSSLVP